MKRFSLAILLCGLTGVTVLGDTVIVNDNFDGYADDTAFQQVWVPTVGNGSAPANPADVTSGILTTDSGLFPGIQGKAIDHIGATASAPGMVNQYLSGSSSPQPGHAVAPSATQNLVLKYDLFDGASGNERMSIGLRNRTTSENILEMGLYNTDSCDPTVSGCSPSVSPVPSSSPGFIAGTGYAYRMINFGPVAAPYLVQPNWQYFQLPPELDRDTDTDSIVSIADIGPGWHQYAATITPTSITLTLDLFRDGLRNTSKTPDGITGIRPGTPGVDASVTIPISLTAAGFDSLRMGGPSGLLSGGTGANAFDNVLLKLVDAMTPTNNADFNNNGIVDAADYTIWRDHLGLTGTATRSTGDANGDLSVTPADYDLWKSHFGLAAGSGSLDAAAVPEPSALLLMLCCSLASLGMGRRVR